jgi:hypothetical protein
MPLMPCSQDGKRGVKFGNHGACYTSPNMKENRKNAIKQALTFTSPDKLHEELKHGKGEYSSDEIAYAKRVIFEELVKSQTKELQDTYKLIEDNKKKELREPDTWTGKQESKL